MAALAVLWTVSIAAAPASAALPEYLECKNVHHTGGWTDSACKVASATHQGNRELIPASRPCIKASVNGKGEPLGAYDDAACTEADPKHEGPFELAAGVGKGKAFKGKSTGPVELLLLGWPYGSVECQSASDRGFVTGPTTIEGLELTFKKCSLSSNPADGCGTFGQPQHTIVSNALSGTTGYIAPPAHTPGWTVTGPPGLPVVSFFCEGVGASVRITGSVVAEATGQQRFETGKRSFLYMSEAEGAEPSETDFFATPFEYQLPGGEYSEPQQMVFVVRFANKGESLELAN